jgi:lipopolysaccharide export system protein LptC
LARSAQTTTSQDGKGVPAAEAHRASREAFALAQRHSRTVRVLKSALPLLAAAMALGFLGYSYVMTPASVAVKADGSAISDGKLVMANPKLDGFTKDNRPYSMNALRAIQDFQNEGVVQLEGISAKLPIDAENWATIDAAGGVYDRDKNTLEIDSEITVTTADGMTAKLKSATIDIGGGGMTTQDPVDIRMDGATITSDTMTIGENGKLLVFEKRVRMDIDPQRLKATQQANGDPDVVN